MHTKRQFVRVDIATVSLGLVQKNWSTIDPGHGLSSQQILKAERPTGLELVLKGLIAGLQTFFEH